MKRKLLILGIFLILSIGCTTKKEEEKQATENMQIIECLKNELGGYLVTENDALNEIPLGNMSDQEKKIAYYYGAYANEENQMVLLQTNLTYEWEVMKDFDLYFAEKYPVYQKYNLKNTGIYILIHNDIEFSDIEKKCNKNINNEEGKNIPENTIEKLNNTSKIVIKANEKEIGRVSSKEIQNEFLNMIKESKQYGENSLCDGNGFTFELLDNKNELIDTIYVWEDGRLIPKSIHNGCSYYSGANDLELRKIIEENTDYIFYNINDYREDNNSDTIEKIFEDGDYNYYLKGEINKVWIHFTLNNLTMTLKNALNNHNIIPKQLEMYEELLIKEKKEPGQKSWVENNHNIKQSIPLDFQK